MPNFSVDKTAQAPRSDKKPTTPRTFNLSVSNMSRKVGEEEFDRIFTLEHKKEFRKKLAPARVRSANYPKYPPRRAESVKIY